MAMEVVLFTLAQDQYAVPVTQVDSIEPPLLVTRLPGTAAFVMGLANLRGTVLPILDLRHFAWPTVGVQADPLATAVAQPSSETAEVRVLVVHVGEITAGLRVDAVLDVVEVDFDRDVRTDRGKGEFRGGESQGDFIDGIVSLKQLPTGLIRLESILNPSLALTTGPAELR
ncbi:hypothetical protein D2Q93_11980 [Alicyclobacillaceae bacterium I2511]|nr:hypothetical protein D2Q93_11980 [Alicyclobacillaceae bacterium I2511]